MTKFKFFKNDNNFVGFECSGHTGYDEYGKTKGEKHKWSDTTF